MLMKGRVRARAAVPHKSRRVSPSPTRPARCAPASALATVIYALFNNQLHCPLNLFIFTVMFLLNCSELVEQVKLVFDLI